MFSAILCCRIKGNGDSRLLGLLESIKKNTIEHHDVEVLIKFDTDDDEAVKILPKLQGWPFQVKHIFDERGRGAMDMHLGYTTLLSIANPSSMFFVTLADDFEVLPRWDRILVDSLKIWGDQNHPDLKNWVLFNEDEKDVFFLQHENPNLNFEYENVRNTTGFEVAPAFSKKLIYLLGGFGHVNFTDAWAILLQRELKNVHNINITKILPRYVKRMPQGDGMSLLEQANREGQRVKNFDFMNTDFYRKMLSTQAQIIAEYYAKRENTKKRAIAQKLKEIAR